MEKIQFGCWHIGILAIIYVAYLFWALFGGLRDRRIKVPTYIIMTILMLCGIIHEFTGIHTVPEIINICIILVIALAKGIVLGKLKTVEKINEIWYMRHNLKYILIWLVFFAVKIATTEILKFITKVDIPMWHMILYFCIYYVCRIVCVFYNNPDMRKEVLEGYKK